MKKSTYIILSIIFCVLLIFSLSACDMFSSSGKSAYDIAVEYGFEGTEQEWLESLKGDKGDPGINGEAGSDGLSAYEIEVKNGYQGSEQEWIDEIKGIKGDTGAKGDDGLSAYEVAVENGFEGTVNQWLESLEGAKGDSGAKGNEGLSAYQVAVANGFVGTEEQWIESLKGMSAYQIAKEIGVFEGTEQEWLESLKGAKGDTGAQGEKGETGAQGTDGLSAYQLALENGFVGTEEQWLESLKGMSAYQIAKEIGVFEGTEQEWLESLKGEKGDTGAQGEKGETGAQGADGLSAYQVALENGFVGTEEQWLESLKGEKGDTGAQGEKGETGAQGEKGETGAQGADGLSAYQLALENGFVGTEEEWLESLKGEKGDIGASYEEDNRTESVHKALKSSVLIASISTTNSLVGGAGSGVIFADDKASGTAYIITNFHVVYNTTEDKLFDKFMVFLYGQSYPVNYLDIGTDVYSSNVGIWAICIGYEPTQDIAVLKIENSNYYRDSIAEPAEISVFDTYVGDGCFAIGNPLGEGFSVTHGIISLESKYKAQYRIEDTDLPVEERRIILQRSIRHNCAINQGNSGGGLFNNDGKLIGINNKGELTYSDGAGNIIVVNGIVYAIPLEIAVGFAQEIIDNYNGVDIYEISINNIVNYLTLQISDSYATYDEITKRVSVEEEIEVSQVKDEVGNPFKDELMAGDILLSFSYQKNGQTYNIDIDRYYIAAECLYFLDEGDTITFTVLRNNIETTVEVTL